jgi:Trypsin-like peptidase domain
MAAVGIIIHISVGAEKRTEYFVDERIRIGSNENSDVQIHTDNIDSQDVWLELELTEDVYRIVNFKESLNLALNGKPLRRYAAVRDGDTIEIPENDIAFAFFSLASKSALITTKREPHMARFIEEAALDAATSTRRADAKAFLREFVRELSREIRWSTKLIVLILAIGFIGGILYLGFAFNRQLRENREQAERQNEVIRKMEEQLGATSNQIGELDKSNKDIMKTVSLASNLRVEYGNSVCLIVGVYDLVDRRNGKTLRYSASQNFQPDPNEPMPTEDGSQKPPVMGLTTEGNGTPVEYDFIGTGFHVGGGYIVTNRHVMQPWEEDAYVKQMMKEYGGRARVKRLVVYFPNFPQPFPLKLRQVGQREDLAIGSIDAALVTPEMPALPLDAESDAVSIGKTVVSMGYPNGPDRLLAMVDDEEARAINAKFGGSRQAIISFLAQNKKIVPLTTQGAITDLDARRIVHDAKTAEGGSGAPLFGQTGKVIGVNFGVFTESNAANMAIPIKFAIDMLKASGWISPDETQPEGNQPPVDSTGSKSSEKN